jgi:hypothetical protein
VVQPFWTVVICKTMRCLGSRIISMKVVNVLKKNYVPWSLSIWVSPKSQVGLFRFLKIQVYIKQNPN